MIEMKVAALLVTAFCVAQVTLADGTKANTTSATLPQTAIHFVTKWGKVEKRRSKDIGFGGQEIVLSRMSQNGEPDSYTGYDVTLLILQNRIAGVTVVAGYYPKKAIWDRLRKAIRDEGLGDIGRAKSGNFTYARIDPVRVARFKAVVAAELGASIPATVPVNLRKAYAVLTSPISELIVGTDFGVAGAPPPGREEVQALARAKRLDLLHNVLCGINPEGRVYAAEAFLEMAKSGLTLSNADKVAISKVRSLPIPIKACEGCVVMIKTAAELLKHLPSGN